MFCFFTVSWILRTMFFETYPVYLGFYWLIDPQVVSYCQTACFIGHVQIISYRFLFHFTKLHSMMWTQFPFNIYVEYEFKNFEHYFNVFWWKKQPSQKNTRESSAIVVTEKCRQIQKLISFWQKKYSFWFIG